MTFEHTQYFKCKQGDLPGIWQGKCNHWLTSIMTHVQFVIWQNSMAPFHGYHKINLRVHRDSSSISYSNIYVTFIFKCKIWVYFLLWLSIDTHCYDCCQIHRKSLLYTGQFSCFLQQHCYFFIAFYGNLHALTLYIIKQVLLKDDVENGPPPAFKQFCTWCCKFLNMC